MTLSTSSSDSIEPRWGPIWLVAMLIVAVFVCAWEMLVRDAGLGPALVDNKTLWADTRHQLNKQGQDAIVLIGGSRMQRAVDIDAMRDRFERPVFQLAIEGSSYLPVLEDLAVDPRVTGTVLISATPALTYNRELPQLDNGRQAEYVANYRRQSLARRLEQKLTLYLQERLALRAPQAQPAKVISALGDSGELPQPHYKTVARDRVARINLELMPGNQSAEGMVNLYEDYVTPYATEEFGPFVNYISTLVDMLRRKGVDVYFIRLPSDGAVRAYEEKLFPREQFWGVLEANVSATFIHYDEYPELAGFVSRDGSHIDASQISEFTRRLNEVLARHQM